MNPSCIRQMFIMINGVAVSLVLDEIPNLVGDAGGVAAVAVAVRPRRRLRGRQRRGQLQVERVPRDNSDERGCHVDGSF